MLKNKILYLLLVLMIFNACSNKQESFENTKALISDAKSKIKTISVSEFIKSSKGNKDYILIDCREGEEFAASHIKEAINIPRGKIEFSSKLTNKKVKIYIYSNNSDRAALAAIALNRLNFSNITVLDGGLSMISESYPDTIEKETDSESDDDDSC